MEEYHSVSGLKGLQDIRYWDENNFIKSLQVKSNGNFMYFRHYRECEDKHVARVKIFRYD